MTSEHMKREIERDFAASYWLKGAVNDAFRRDAVDALADAELLSDVLRARLNEIQGQAA